MQFLLPIGTQGREKCIGNMFDFGIGGIYRTYYKNEVELIFKATVVRPNICIAGPDEVVDALTVDCKKWVDGVVGSGFHLYEYYSGAFSSHDIDFKMVHVPIRFDYRIAAGD